MKLTATLLLCLTAGTALAHGTHDDAPLVPLQPGTRLTAPAPASTADSEAEARKPDEANSDKKRAAEDAPAAPKP